MAGKPAPARVKKWRGTHYLFYFDYATGKSMRRTCESLKAFNVEQRRALQRRYRAKELNDAAEVLLNGGRVSGDAVLLDDIADYLKDCARRVETRQENPEVRAGLSEKSLVSIKGTIGHFKQWLQDNRYTKLKTKDLNAAILTLYVDRVIREETRLGNKRKKRSAATVNYYLRHIKGCLNWIQRQTPRRFQDFPTIVAPLKPVTGNKKPPTAFAPAELKKFLDAALEYEDEERTVHVKRRRSGRKRRAYEQPAPSKAATPVSRLFLLLALTGCRLGEALALKWEDVDLDRGRITIRAQKTGVTRWIPLTSAAEGEIAPKFIDLLTQWLEEFEEASEENDLPKPVYVLPHTDLEAPVFPKGPWQVINRQSGLSRIGPQMLRQNFTSYAASLGIPSAVAAMWQGHSADVAEKHYRAQVLDRTRGAANFEDAMGLKEAIEALLQAD